MPMTVLGFSLIAMNTYIFVVYLYSTFVHANLGWRFPVIERIFVTPRFHHWHHGIEREARHAAQLRQKSRRRGPAAGSETTIRSRRKSVFGP